MDSSTFSGISAKCNLEQVTCKLKDVNQADIRVIDKIKLPSVYQNNILKLIFHIPSWVARPWMLYSDIGELRLTQNLFNRRKYENL